MGVLRSLLVLPLLAALVSSAPVDLDVAVPPGTPMDWMRGLRAPVPTGHGGRIPVPTKSGPGETTNVQRSEERPGGYGATDCYQYFGITTIDIMGHVAIQFPSGSPGLNEDDVATGTGWNEGAMPWLYPPEMPAELFWMGAVNALRRRSIS